MLQSWLVAHGVEPQVAPPSAEEHAARVAELQA